MQYYCHDFRAAVATCRDILQHDPYHLTCLPVYLCTLHELQQKNELFYRKLLALGCSTISVYEPERCSALSWIDTVSRPASGRGPQARRRTPTGNIVSGPVVSCARLSMSVKQRETIWM